MAITKAVIPVAGWGTRMLPITKVIEKCMLPVGTRPVVDYIVQDVIRAGITDIYFVVGEQSTQLQSFYRTNIPLNDYLRKKGKDELLSLVAPLKGVSIHFIVQPSTGAYGTSVPVGLVSEFIDESESAVVIMGDQFFMRDDGGSNTADLVSLAEEKESKAALYGVEVPWEDISRGGAIESDAEGNFVRIVEKPSREEAPSNLNNASFYIFNKEIFELARTLPANPRRGEYEVTDALNAYVANGGQVGVGIIKGDYLDCGTPEAWLDANTIVAGKSGHAT